MNNKVFTVIIVVMLAFLMSAMAAFLLWPSEIPERMEPTEQMECQSDVEAADPTEEIGIQDMDLLLNPMSNVVKPTFRPVDRKVLACKIEQIIAEKGLFENEYFVYREYETQQTADFGDSVALQAPVNATEPQNHSHSAEHEEHTEVEPEEIPSNNGEDSFEEPDPEPTEAEKPAGAASEIWYRMKSYGWSDVVCAGIMGNIMAEVGGQSFEIAYWLDINGYYGMCMWNKSYNPGVVGRDLYGQVDYIYETIQGQFKSYGLPYDGFLALQDPGEAAIQFAKAYERCTSASYNVRKSNAAKAYDEFAR